MEDVKKTLRVFLMRGRNWVKKCWEEKERRNRKDQYGKERERYHDRNGWGLRRMKLTIAKIEDWKKSYSQEKKIFGDKWRKIRETRYNRYKDTTIEGRGPKYLEKKYLRKEKTMGWQLEHQ